MVIAHHIIFTGYGHWLPNDPRGSLSREFRNPTLQRLGEIHFGRKRTQPTRDALKAFYVEARKHLAHQVLWFESRHRDVIGKAFRGVIASEGLTCYACAILQNHAHLLVRKHRLTDRQMMQRLRNVSRERMWDCPDVPDPHPIWSEDPYVKYKHHPQEVRACVEYIQGNFRKHRIAPQEWDFVIPYDDWPLHKRKH